MSNSIRSIIVAALPSGVADTYSTYVDAVEKDITEAFTVISENVKDAVLANTDFSEEDVRHYGEQAGLIFRPIPEPVVETAPEAEVSENAGVNEKLDAILNGLSGIKERVERIENAARANGISL